MQIERWMIGALRTMVMTSTLVVGLAACDGDDGEGGDGVAEDADAGETFDRTDAEVGESDGETTLDRTDAEVGDSDGGDFGEGASTDTGEPSGCAAAESEGDCVAMQGCAAVLGYEIVQDGRDSWCTMADEQYIGCVETINLCPPLTKVLCEGEQMWSTTDCVPENLMVCEAPGPISGTCA
jgi:hypothetical protein